jgi:TBC1 domain family member 5
LQADHTEALQLLLHYEPPLPPNDPATLVEDAIFLDRNRTIEGGATLIARYSGLTVDVHEQRPAAARRPPALQLSQRHRKNLSPAFRNSGSPGRSPTRFLSRQKGLETLFQEVSGNLQKRTEGWNVSKAVRAAAGEVRRNVNNFQSGTTSPRNSLDATQAPSQSSTGQETEEELRRRLSTLEKRNKALSRMLADALEELRAQKGRELAMVAESSFNTALAKMQFVQVYLADSDITIPGQDGLLLGETTEGQPQMVVTSDSGPALLTQRSKGPIVATQQQEDAIADRLSTPPVVVAKKPNTGARVEGTERPIVTRSKEGGDGRLTPSTLSSPQPRPPLAQSPLSWMLGEGRHRSDFVSSSTPPPEQRRDSVPKVKPKRLFADEKDAEGKNGSESEDDGFTMRSLHGRG